MITVALLQVKRKMVMRNPVLPDLRTSDREKKVDRNSPRHKVKSLQVRALKFDF